jgi:uncharacterized protein (DUF1778 family)
MKSEVEKVKPRNRLSANDADFQVIEEAARLCGQPLSCYMRETLVTQSRAVVAAKKVGKRGGR